MSRKRTNQDVDVSLLPSTEEERRATIYAMTQCGFSVREIMASVFGYHNQDVIADTKKIMSELGIDVAEYMEQHKGRNVGIPKEYHKVYEYLP
jgi:uncharacterized protein with gpF-like domain